MYGKEIKSARIVAGVTQSQVAKATGLPQNTISWIELDKGIPNIQQCVILAEYYGITVDELIGHDNAKSIKVSDSFNNNSGNINFNS